MTSAADAAPVRTRTSYPPIPKIDPPTPGREPVPSPATEDSLIVAFEADARPAEIEAQVTVLGASVMQHYRTPGLVAVRVPAGVTAAQFGETLEALPSVRRVEGDLIFRLYDRPDDEQFGDQWALENTGQEGGVAGADIGVRDAWIEVTGQGSGVIGVVDSGVDLDHPDLVDNLWVNPGEIPANGIDDDNNGYVDDVYGIDQIEFDGEPDDSPFEIGGHGTLVSGVIGARGNNGIGVSGVLWETEILACRIFSEFGFTSLSRILACLDYYAWAKTSGAADVVAINASWGAYGFSWSLYDTMEELGRLGILVVASAGNDGVNIDEFTQTPAGFDLDNIVSVAATDRRGELAAFSNFGTVSVDLAAPGVNVLTTAVPGRR